MIITSQELSMTGDNKHVSGDSKQVSGVKWQHNKYPLLYNTMQKNETDTGDLYEYKKTVPMQRIGMNTGKQYSFEKQCK